MSEVKISVEVDGQQYNIEDCFWTFVEPCGCTSASMTTRHYVDGVGHVGYITTEDMAWLEFCENRGVREQEQARGAEVKLIRSDDFMSAMGGKCEHVPTWGRPAIPDSKQWGLSIGHRVIHLVDVRSESEGRHAFRVPMCSEKRDYFEIGPSVLQEKPMCKKCLKAVAL